mgnify:CR=1 FL=1
MIELVNETTIVSIKLFCMSVYYNSHILKRIIYEVEQIFYWNTTSNAFNQRNLKPEFNQEEESTLVVSGLTYVRGNQKWHYICVFVDLCNREIIGCSTRPNKDSIENLPL